MHKTHIFAPQNNAINNFFTDLPYFFWTVTGNKQFLGLSLKIPGGLDSKCYFSGPGISQGISNVTLDLEGVDICHVLKYWLQILYRFFFLNQKWDENNGQNSDGIGSCLWKTAWSKQLKQTFGSARICYQFWLFLPILAMKGDP